MDPAGELSTDGYVRDTVDKIENIENQREYN